MRRALTAALLAGAAVVVGGCGSTAPTPYVQVDNYLTALGEGNFANACALLDGNAQASLERLSPGHKRCASVFARCLPNKATSLSRDQTQQLYANINLKSTGKVAVALVSGTAVANTLKKVTLADEHSGWMLSSYGEALRRCRH